MKQKALLLLFLIALGCQSDNENSSSTIDEISESGIFPNFKQFPERQFKSIQLNQSQEETMALISAMPLKEIYSGEVSHFILPADSTELIIPNSPTLVEFKVFLKSTTYLDDEANFYAFLVNRADKTTASQNSFSVLYFEQPKNPFKLTYFHQNEMIRLHFMAASSGG